MSEVLRDILDTSFAGSVKTATLTLWNQDTKSFDFAIDDRDKAKLSQYFVNPEPRLDKVKLAEHHKLGLLPQEVQVTEKTTRSIRTRR